MPSPSPSPSPSERSSRRRPVAIGLAVTAVVIGVAWVTVPRDRSTAVDVASVVDRFRTSTVPTPESTAVPSVSIVDAVTSTVTSTVTSNESSTIPRVASSVASSPSLAEPGVYRYETQGFESIDALGGVRHEYPAVSTITVTDDRATGGCGRSFRWDVLVERYEEWQVCLSGTVAEWQPFSLQYHEFFEQETPERVVCDVAVPLTAPGTIQQECLLDERPWSPRWEYLGEQDRRVDETVVRVHHVRMVVDDTDELPESYVQNWFVRDDGLPVEVTVDKRSVNPNPIGGVVEYIEAYRIILIDLEPLS